MLEHSSDINFWESFFIKLHKNNINNIHSSNEYDSFPLLCTVLKKLKKKGVQFEHVVKLAEPSFDDGTFSEKRFKDKIENYRKSLDSVNLDAIQWMWRKDIDNDKKRINNFIEKKALIKKSINEEIKLGNINKALCFPYTEEFANSALSTNLFDGLVVYWNPEETSYLDCIKKAHKLKKTTYAIRPFNSGKSKKTTKELLDFTFQKNLISSSILTATSEKHVNEVIEYIKDHETYI